MKIGIVGYHKLTTEEATAAHFLLDSILTRYKSDSNILILGGHVGVEAIAERVAKRKNWKAAAIRHIENSNTRWNNFLRRRIDEKVVEESDILVIIEPRNFPTSHAAKKSHNMGKVAWEFYV